MPADDDSSYAARLVRENDRARYYSILFAAEKLRRDLFALYGFAAEIERVPDQVSEPALGEMRLQYWRDALEGIASKEGRAETPALRAIASAIARHSLPIAPLVALIEAQRADLYSDPPATIADVEGFLGETQSALFQLGALIGGAGGKDTAEAAGHAGVAYGIARRLTRLATDRAHGRSILPADLLAKEGLAGASVFATPPPAALAKVVAAMAEIARDHLRLARRHLQDVPRRGFAVFLPLALVEPRLLRAVAAGPAITTRPVHLSDLETLFRIGLARLTWQKGD